MRVIQIETLPAGKAIVTIDTLTHAVSEGGGAAVPRDALHRRVAFAY